MKGDTEGVRGTAPARGGGWVGKSNPIIEGGGKVGEGRKGLGDFLIGGEGDGETYGTEPC